MWVGTTAGLARYSAPGHPCIADAGSQVGEWKYMWGLRWLPGNGVTSVVSHENITFVGNKHCYLSSLCAVAAFVNPCCVTQAPMAA